MGYPITVALRYLASKKNNMISISTALAIGGVLLGVAALTIVMSVTGGFQEHLKALGAKNDAILRIFVYQGGLIGLTGTALGILIGWLSCRFLLAYAFPLDPKVYFISRLPVSMHPFEFVVPALVALGICLVATILPAVYAAKVRPADGLRDE
jgi:lipoprotein-releasing system permease protein